MVARIIVRAGRWLYERTQILVRPRTPEPGHHRQHDHHNAGDAVAVVVFAAVALVSAARGLSRMTLRRR
jgi:hypothetical protein